MTLGPGSFWIILNIVDISKNNIVPLQELCYILYKIWVIYDMYSRK